MVTFIIVLFIFMILERILGRTISKILLLTITAGLFAGITWFIEGAVTGRVFPGTAVVFYVAFVFWYIALYLFDKLFQFILGDTK